MFLEKERQFTRKTNCIDLFSNQHAKKMQRCSDLKLSLYSNDRTDCCNQQLTQQDVTV